MIQSTKAVYDRVIDLRIATPQIIINYGMFLEENQYFEEAFKVSSIIKFQILSFSDFKIIKKEIYLVSENYIPWKYIVHLYRQEMQGEILCFV